MTLHLACFVPDIAAVFVLEVTGKEKGCIQGGIVKPGSVHKTFQVAQRTQKLTP